MSDEPDYAIKYPSDKLPERIESAVELILQYGSIEGDHHKTWVLDQVLRRLLGDEGYKDFREKDDQFYGDEYGEWDEGIAP